MKLKIDPRSRQKPTTCIYLLALLGTLLLPGAEVAAETVAAWNWNGYGQTNVPTDLTNAIAIAGGGGHSLALRADGRVSAWGLNSAGQCLVPTSLTSARAIAAGYWHSLGLRSNGTVLHWGNSSYGLSITPASATNLTAVAAGDYHSLALRSNGTVVAWGAGTSYNSSPYFGQSLVPTNLTDVMAIAAGGYHSLALRSNGTVIAWGWNAFSQTNVPPSLTNVTAIAAGASNSVALRRDGTVVVWGSNAYGQTNVPPGLSDVVAIAAGAGHLLALRADGSLVAWGWNSYSQTNLPAGLSNFTAIAAGAFHNLALVNLGPVTFLNQPVGLTVFKGETAQFGAAALGQPPPSYQWLFNGNPLADATNRMLFLTNVQFASAGNYQLVAAQPAGAITSRVAQLTVNDSSPYFIVQPTNQVGILNSNAIFVVQVGGIPPLFYQWQRDGTDLIGQTNVLLTVPAITPGAEGYYRLVARNAAGTNASNSAFLDVLNLAEALNATNLTWAASTNPPWVIQRQVTHDGLAAVSITSTWLSGGSSLQTKALGPGTLTFWWRQTTSFAQDGFSLYLNGQRVAQGTTYSAQWQQQTIYLPSGNNNLEWRLSAVSGTSSTGYLDEVNFTSGATAPLLTSFVADRTVPAGSNVTFSIGTGGTPPLAYQWKFAGIELPGATNASLALINVQPASTGQYEVVVTNAFGRTNETAWLTVTNTSPVILAAPASVEMVRGGTVFFETLVRGSDPLSYQWQFENADLPGATNATLQLYQIQPEHAGNYRVVITNAFGTAVSPPATLTLVPTVIVGWGSVFTSSPNPPLGLTNVAAISGGDNFSAALRTDGTVFAWGWDAFSRLNVPVGLNSVTRIAAGGFHGSTLLNNGTVVNWGDSFFDDAVVVPSDLFNVVDIAAGDRFNLALKRDSSVVVWGDDFLGPLNMPTPLTNIVALGAGQYHGLAVRRDGTVVAWGYHYSGQTNVPPTATNIVAVSAGYAHSMALRRDGSVLTWGSGAATNLPSGLTNIVAIAAGRQHGLALREDGAVSAWGEANSGQLAVPAWLTNVVAIAGGNAHSLALLNDGSPYITRQPWTQTALPGETVRFDVVALGVAPRAYQWYCNQSLLPGATNASLLITNTPLTSAGIYHCVVTNSIGSVTSAPAWLTVLRPAPQIVAAGFGFPGSPNFGLRLVGMSGHGPIVLYASSNLIHWESIQTNAPTMGELLLHDPASGVWPQRFYRVLEE